MKYFNTWNMWFHPLLEVPVFIFPWSKFVYHLIHNRTLLNKQAHFSRKVTEHVWKWSCSLAYTLENTDSLGSTSVLDCQWFGLNNSFSDLLVDKGTTSHFEKSRSFNNTICELNVWYAYSRGQEEMVKLIGFASSNKESLNVDTQEW